MKSEKELFDKAEKLYHGYSKTRFPVAVKAFSDLLELYPDNGEAWSMKSTMQSSMFDYDGALYSIDKAISLDSDNHSFWEIKYLLLSKLYRYEYDSITFTDTKKNKNFTIQYFSGKDDFTTKYLDLLNTFGKLSSDGNTSKYSCYKSIGRIHKENEKYEEAIEAFELCEKYEEIYYEKLQKSMAKIGRKRNRAARHRNNHLHISQCYEKLGNLDEALSSIEKYCSDLEKGDFRWIHKARILLNSGFKKDADKLYLEVIEGADVKYIETDDDCYVFHQSTAYCEMGDYQKAKDVLLLLESKALNNERVRKSLAEKISEIEIIESQEVVKS